MLQTLTDRTVALGLRLRLPRSESWLVLAALFLGLCAPSRGEGERIPSFPGAVGFGAFTPAGRGGQILRVTHLDEHGPGSLREAIETPGPRIILFEVAGVIDLNKGQLAIAEPFVTVAGQTAPSPGITIIRGSLMIVTHDVLIQHIRVRPGDCGQPMRSGWEPDGLCAAGGEAHDIVIDHCSAEWAVDENLSVSGPLGQGPKKTAHRVTLSHCLIAEGLNNSSHSKGRHSKGSLVHDECKEIAIIGNLYAHNVQRNPYFKAYTTGAIVNNVIYNPGSKPIQMGFVNAEWKGSGRRPQNCRVSVVGNVMIHGKDTWFRLPLVTGRGDAYMEDNLALDRANRPLPVKSRGIRLLAKKPAWPEGLTGIPSGQTLQDVIDHAGARPGDRDATDRRIIRELQERGGRVIDSQEEVGGYPKTAMVVRPLTVPEGNMDDWLAGMADEVE